MTIQVEITLRGESETDARGYESRPTLAQLEMEAEWFTAVDVYRTALDKLTAPTVELVEGV